MMRDAAIFFVGFIGGMICMGVIVELAASGPPF